MIQKRHFPKIILVLACVLASAFLQADDAPPVKVLNGVLKPEVQKELGQYGARVFRSGTQWAAFLERLAALGWTKPADNPLAAVDFSRDMVACVFQHGDEGNNFVLRRNAFDGKQAEVEIGMSYIIYKKHGETVYKWKFIAFTVPQTDSARFSVFTFHPMNGGPYPTLDKAFLEWSVTIGPECCDVVGDLKGKIQAKATTVNRGDDIQITFTLMFGGGSMQKAGIFSEQRDSVSVWDGKYSEGYRNHAFIVTTPDGKNLLLRPKEINQWDKNAPHLEVITATKPYVLPGWNNEVKSLKQLGLDTSIPGTYKITGLYMETAGLDNLKLNEKPCWGGEIATNTVSIEVK